MQISPKYAYIYCHPEQRGELIATTVILSEAKDLMVKIRFFTTEVQNDKGFVIARSLATPTLSS